MPFNLGPRIPRAPMGEYASWCNRPAHRYFKCIAFMAVSMTVLWISLSTHPTTTEDELLAPFLTAYFESNFHQQCGSGKEVVGTPNTTCNTLSPRYEGMSAGEFINTYPSACLFSHFGGHAAVMQLLAHRHWVFVGDSVMRYQVGACTA